MQLTEIMNQLIIIFMVIANGPYLMHCRHKSKLWAKKIHNLENRYPYIVALIRNNATKQHAGSLISSEWVLTAAHCIDDSITQVQYGNMAEEPEESKMTRAVISRITHPGYQYQEGGICSNDIGLCQINPIAKNVYGRPSAIDYKSLLGFAVMYVSGYEGDESGKTVFSIIGEGVVTDCTTVFEEVTDIRPGPYLCVAPKCSKVHMDNGRGDSGGPLLYDGKIIGVVTGRPDKLAIGIYTPVSPYLTWIQEQILPSETPIPDIL